MKEDRQPLPARVSQPEAANLYDSLAKYYDLWGRLTESKARKRCLTLSAIADGEQVLEVAVGTGLAFVELVRRNPSGRNVGIDLSKGMLAKAKQRLRRADCSNYELSPGTALEIEAEAESFDVLLNCYMFDLLDESEWPKVLHEYYRVLKPAGRLVLANMTFGEKWGSEIYPRLYRWSPTLMGGCRPVSLSGPLEQHGFRVERREYIQQFFFPSEIILAARQS